MALTFRPRPGTLFICNAATCFKPNPRSVPFELGTQRILGEVGHVVAPSLWSDWTGCWSTRPAGECSSRQGSKTKTWTRSAKGVVSALGLDAWARPEGMLVGVSR